MTLRPFTAPTTPRRWDTGRRAIAAIRAHRDEYALIDMRRTVAETLATTRAVR